MGEHGDDNRTTEDNCKGRTCHMRSIRHGQWFTRRTWIKIVQVHFQMSQEVNTHSNSGHTILL
jgi:hypothetical protein